LKKFRSWTAAILLASILLHLPFVVRDETGKDPYVGGEEPETSEPNLKERILSQELETVRKE